MGRAQGQKNVKSECLNILWVHMDHLVMFVHRNEDVVPLANTTINNMLPTKHHDPRLTTTATGQNECKTGPNDASRCLGPGMFFISLLFSFIN